MEIKGMKLFLKIPNKYEHFITDITPRDVSVDPFEIASKGYISPSNKANLKKMLSSANPVLSFKAKCDFIKSFSPVIIPHFLENGKH